jgi:hypothetical protein
MDISELEVQLTEVSFLQPDLFQLSDLLHLSKGLNVGPSVLLNTSDCGYLLVSDKSKRSNNVAVPPFFIGREVQLFLLSCCCEIWRPSRLFMSE